MNSHEARDVRTLLIWIGERVFDHEWDGSAVDDLMARDVAGTLAVWARDCLGGGPPYEWVLQAWARPTQTERIHTELATLVNDAGIASLLRILKAGDGDRWHVLALEEAIRAFEVGATRNHRQLTRVHDLAERLRRDPDPRAAAYAGLIDAALDGSEDGRG